MKAYQHLPKHLVVEGKDDLYSVVSLMKEHVSWSSEIDTPPLYIDDGGGCDKILADDYLPRRVKSSSIHVLGVLLDADENLPGVRYQRLFQLCSPYFPAMQRTLPSNGLVVDNQDGKRFGIWIMPDNVLPGSLETFLARLVPSSATTTWDHAVKSTKYAKEIRAPYQECHEGKANLHTWLAWQDPPGQPYGIALTAKCFDKHSAAAHPFVSWFKLLYSM